MGVKSLWSLLAPVGRPVPLENIEGTALAIDSSIWIYQFQATMRDKEGRALTNAHVLGFLRRICKLLFYGIRPVFVFDGGAPTLKRNTISERKKKKSGAAASHAKIAERLLAAQMRREALGHADVSHPPSSKSKQKVPSGPVVLDENTVYLEDVDSSITKTPGKKQGAKPSPPSSKKKNRFHDHDPYQLPEVNMEEQVVKATRTHAPDPRLATEEELRTFIEEMRPEDFDVASPAFRELPTEVQYEIVGDLRLKSRQTSYKRLQNMLKKASTPLDFSREQIKNLQQRNSLTQQLLMTTDSIGKANLTIPVRVASERNREYLLIKNEGADGGWVLGIRDDGTRTKPIEIDQDVQVPVSEDDSDMEMEEVSIPRAAPVDPDLRAYQQTMALSAISKRSQAGTTAKPVRRIKTKPLFDLDDEDDLPRFRSLESDEEDPELAMAIQASLDSQGTKGTLSHASSHSAEPSSSSHLPQAPASKSTSLVVEELHSRSPPAAVRTTRLSLDDDDEDLYASPSRLVTALSIAGAGPPLRSSLSFTQHTTPTSTFGKPSSLLLPQKAPLHPFSPSAQSPNAEENILPAEGHEEPALSSPLERSVVLPELSIVKPSVVQSPVPLVDDEESDDMEEVAMVSSTLASPVNISPAVPLSPPPLMNGTIRVDAPRKSSVHVSFDLPPSSSPSPTVSPSKVRVTEEDSGDSAIEWSRSPSPIGGLFKEADVPVDQRQAEKEEGWDAAQEMDPHKEAGEFAQFLSQVKGKDLDTVRNEIDDEIRELNRQKKAAMRDSEDITQHMISQIMLMLRLFGIPYITAPMEAEAQCAELVSLGLVEGIITDDSDVFLFGGLRVYKNMFNQSKTVECFLLSDLARELGLQRDALIRLAYLLGSDYVDGLPGVGPVVAMELIKEFPGEDGLHKFKDWWTRVQSGRDREEDNNTKFRKRFKKKFKDLYLSPEWPNPLVRDAYYHPTVDTSEEPFKWGMPDLDGLRHFLHEELGWHETKVDDLLLPIIQKMSKRNQAVSMNRQGNLNGFFDMAPGAGSCVPRKRQAYASKRLQQVVSDFRKEQARMQQSRGTRTPIPGQDHDSDIEDDAAPPKKRTKTTASRKGKKKTSIHSEKGGPKGRTINRKATRATAASSSGPNKDTDGPEMGEESGDEFEDDSRILASVLPSGPLTVRLRPQVSESPAEEVSGSR
ncbi:PIN domain-like protein [Paxillus ammoniavirescens]|nr:PIN domain-like protein [Paxillus ammoniavirescens]